MGGPSQKERGGSRKKRTYLVQAQVSVVSRCCPPPLARCSAPPGAADGRDFRRLSRFLRETTVNPHYCWSCRSGPCIVPPDRGSGAVSQQPAGAGSEPGYRHAGSSPLPVGCLRPGSYVCARMCIRVYVHERENVCESEQKG